jgi:hypothetical protein
MATKEPASKEMTMVLIGLLTQAALVLLELLLELPGVPEGEGEELDWEDRAEEETEDGWVGEDGLGEATLSWFEEPEPVVVVGVGWFAGTGVDWVDEVGVVVGGAAAMLELGDPPPPLVIVKVGEILSALPITNFNMMSADLESALYMRRLTGNDVRISVRIPSRDDDVHLPSSNRETAGKGSF